MTPTSMAQHSHLGHCFFSLSLWCLDPQDQPREVTGRKVRGVMGKEMELLWSSGSTSLGIYCGPGWSGAQETHPET